MRIGAGGLLQAVPRGVAGAIIHQQYLVDAAGCRQRLVQLPCQGRDVGLLVIHRHDDRQAGRDCCHAHSMGHAGAHFKRGVEDELGGDEEKGIA